MTPVGENTNPHLSTTRLFHKYPPPSVSNSPQVRPHHSLKKIYSSEPSSEVNSRATASHRPQYLPDMAANYSSSCPGWARVHWFLPRYVQLNLSSGFPRGGTQVVLRLSSQAPGHKGWKHRLGTPSEPTQKWLWLDLARSGLRAPRHPGAALAAATGSSQQAARTCAPPQLASETHTGTWHQASLLGSEGGGKIRPGRHGS